MPSIFTRIIQKEIPSEIVYQDERVTAFKDINPLAPVHILIVPNKEVPTVNDLTQDDEAVLGYLFTIARQLAKAQGIADTGYRLVMNCGADGGQEVAHIHLHLLGGRKLGPILAR